MNGLQETQQQLFAEVPIDTQEKFMSKRLSVFCALVLFAGAIASAQTQQSVLVIEGGTLIDGNGGAPARDAVVIVRGSKIETVSRKGQASYPAGAQVIRADGKFILPGLWDAHCHYQWWMPELLLSYGITSASLATADAWGVATRDAIEHGKIPGPRLFIQPTSVRAPWRAGLVQSDPVIDTPEKAREAVRRSLESKPANISLARGVSFEVYQAAIDEAHKAGLPAVAQPIGPMVYAKEAVLAGLNVLEHAGGVGYSIAKDPAQWKGWGEVEEHSLDPTVYAGMDDQKAAELIRLVVDRKAFLEPDFIAHGRGFHKRKAEYELEDFRLYSDHRLAYVPEDRREKELSTYHEFDGLDPAVRELRNKGYQNMKRFMKEFVDAGGKLLTGTDTSSWSVPGIGLHHEFDILVNEVGLTPMQVIVAATRNPAEAWRVLDRQGTIEPGKLADLVIVNNDPLADIRNLKKIEWVIQDGKVVDRAYHPWFDPPVKNAYFGSLDWVAALKQRTQQGIRSTTGLTDVGPVWSFGQPTPGIESASPRLVTEGGPSFMLTIRGVNFTNKSLVYVEGHPVPTKLVSEAELNATIDSSVIARPATLAIIVKNIGVTQQPQWGGGVSNVATMLVNFRY
jgi:hypothetical protein